MEIGLERAQEWIPKFDLPADGTGLFHQEATAGERQSFNSVVDSLLKNSA